MKLVVVTPSRGSVSIGYRDLVRGLERLCEERDVEFDIIDELLAQEIHQARNLLLYKVSELEDEDWALWLDSDVSCKPRLFIDKMHRPEEIIARVYPIKPHNNDPPGWAASPFMTQSRGRQQNQLVWNEDKTMLQASYVGFGAVMMRATAAKKCRERYGVQGRGAPRGVGRGIPAFDHRVNEWDIRCGEDVSFCHRWNQEMGERIWIAPDGRIRNGTYSGIFLEQVTRTLGLPEGVRAP